MRLDHLLSKDRVRVVLLLSSQGLLKDRFAVGKTIARARLRACEANVGCVSKDYLTTIPSLDAFRGNTRSHPEHDG